MLRSCSSLLLGSPPRMRGKVEILEANKPYMGITPAYAGKRGLLGLFDPHEWDHPRVCGEKIPMRPSVPMP